MKQTRIITGEAPKIKKLTVLFMEEEAALAAAQAGQVDVAHTAASYADQAVDGFGLLSVASVDNRGFNLPAIAAEEKDGITYGNDFLKDVQVRRAINIGINRQEMIDNVLSGHGTPAYSVCDTKCPGIMQRPRWSMTWKEPKTSGRCGMEGRKRRYPGKRMM